jgi:hypothetical protein
MPTDVIPSRLAAIIGQLNPKTKQPNSAKTLNAWIAQAESKIGPEGRSGRLGWLVASSVATAAIQRAVDTDGRQLFLLKGGTWLQHRLIVTARTTRTSTAWYAATSTNSCSPWKMCSHNLEARSP